MQVTTSPVMSLIDLLLLFALASFGAASGALGVFLTLRGRTLVVDAMSHAALPGIALVGLMAGLGLLARSGFALVTGALAFAGLAAVMILGLRRHPRVSEDSAMALVLSSFFGLGVMLFGWLQLVDSSQSLGLTSFALGQVATMSLSEAWSLLAVAVLVTAVIWAGYRGLCLLVFDADYAATTGWPLARLDALLMGLATLLLAVGLRSVGAIMLLGLVAGPALIGLAWAKRMPQALGLAAASGALACLVGGTISLKGTQAPTGPTIILTLAALFALVLAARALRQAGTGAGRQSGKPARDPRGLARRLVRASADKIKPEGGQA